MKIGTEGAEIDDRENGKMRYQIAVLRGRSRCGHHHLRSEGAYRKENRDPQFQRQEMMYHDRRELVMNRPSRSKSLVSMP